MIRIGSTISVGIVLSAAILAGVSAQAADRAENVSRHVGVAKAAQKTLIVAQTTQRGTERATGSDREAAPSTDADRIG